MKKLLRKILALTLLAGSALIGRQAAASHYQGTELTYSCVAPGMYQVQFKVYRDCAGSTIPNTIPITLIPQGCGSQRVVTLTKVPGTNAIGNFYCPQQGAPQCAGTVNPNQETETFSAMVTFTAAEQACPNWILNWSECCRPNSATLLGNEEAYAEAYLNLSAGINNNSPQFGTGIPLFVGVNNLVELSAYATDADGDSLVYSLQPALRAPNTTTTYKPNFTAQNFIPAFMPPALNTKNGSLSFIPTTYVANAVQGENHYIAVVQVEDYRKINGTMVKVGAVRRDFGVTVIDMGQNMNPTITGITANGVSVSSATMMELRPGTPLNFQFSSTDQNATDQLTLTSDVANIMPGATFSTTTATKPTGTITWTPTATEVREQPYFFHITVKDNACPVMGFQTHTFGVKVSATGSVTGTGKALSAHVGVSVFPNPFSKEVNFRINQTPGMRYKQIVICNSLGQEVDRIFLSNMAAGEQVVSWPNGAEKAPGQYIARIITENGTIENLRFAKIK